MTDAGYTRQPGTYARPDDAPEGQTFSDAQAGGFVREGRWTFVDATTYRQATERYEWLLGYVHRQLHRNVPMNRCDLCRYLREGLEE
jgi:hypothetical protein